jgi:hypothetical protein
LADGSQNALLGRGVIELWGGGGHDADPGDYFPRRLACSGVDCH